MAKKYLNLGVGLVATSSVVGSIPNISETTAEAGIKSNFSTGLSNVGNVLPSMGKAKGATMVMKSIKKIKPIKFKGAMKL